ncbi:MAG: hypothetical protein Q8P17_01425 [bacterium]|nr:hypothetical protein [bacterium]
MKGKVMHRYFIAYSITSRKGNGWGYEFGNSLLDLEKPISSMADVAVVEKKLEENINAGRSGFRKVCLLSFISKPF